MKKLSIFFVLLCVPLFSQETTVLSETAKKPFQLQFGITYYGANIAFSGLDIDFAIPFYQKGIHSLLFKTTLPVFIPSSILQPKLPYVLFGANWELQYAIVTQKGFYFAMELGLGVASEFFQVPVYSIVDGFQDNFVSNPYGMFTSGLRLGYDFKSKYNKPLQLAMFMGYRMQFPFNFTIKHFILYGMSLSYTFDFGSK